ncbi:GNAT family N-acetyltransferase [Cellulomonas sp. zg-ZUI222]|uniref:GNAT family N-acetyltransferase n=1 Tax=Cellulomonas wangleii TaxID=2816956 RepID=A0ABX8D981_9CELL|nr:GNAT family N-acetyltransferase [Cellulomonas sp. zg-ZUI22]MBO0919454.1 GNAT family N-acetyltransferase [Cellulomonas wangleii]MBO0924406.1 GNAT family N-acetyltransferase [Cellulomonas wangleii]QVI63998.1 GNAT family N-acetyltransferase [Cellulomonas wangleii]
MSDVDIWPLTGLRVVCGDLELRAPDDRMLLDLARLAAQGVHQPDYMPFLVPWTRGTPVQVARSVMTYQWGLRERTAPSDWAIELAVVRDGEPLGTQGLYAKDYLVARSAETGSWLGLRHQHGGVGTRMRLMVLHLLFEGLDARYATSSAFVDNPGSSGVSRKIGYRPNGILHQAREGGPVDSQLYVLDRADWDARPDHLRPEIRIEGLGPVRSQLGLSG